MADIPVPLRSGQFTLDGGTYTGDVGSLISTDPAILNLENGATANVTVEGVGDVQGPGGTAGDAHFTFIEAVNGTETLNLTAIGGGRGSPFGPGFATVYLNPHTTVTGLANTSLDGNLTVLGGPGSKLKDFSGSAGAGSMVIDTNIAGTGTITMPLDAPGSSGLLEINGRVGHGETIDVHRGLLQLDQPLRFLGQIKWEASPDPFQRVVLQGLHADSYTFDGAKLHLFVGPEDIADINIAKGASNVPDFHVSQASAGVMVSATDPTLGLTGVIGTPLPTHLT